MDAGACRQGACGLGWGRSNTRARAGKVRAFWEYGRSHGCGRVRVRCVRFGVGEVKHAGVCGQGACFLGGGEKSWTRARCA
eukprot:85935-Chlamydomonas_euryale.AAC.1